MKELERERDFRPDCHLHTADSSLQEVGVTELLRWSDTVSPSPDVGGVWRDGVSHVIEPLMEHTGSFLVQPLMTLKHLLDQTLFDSQTSEHLCSL